MKYTKPLFFLLLFFNASTFCGAIKNFREDGTEIQSTIFHISQLSDKQIEEINQRFPEAVQGWRYCTLEEEARSHNELPQFFKYKKDKTWTESKLIGYKFEKITSCNCSRKHKPTVYLANSEWSSTPRENYHDYSCALFNDMYRKEAQYDYIKHAEHLYFNDFQLLKAKQIDKLIAKKNTSIAAILLGGLLGSAAGLMPPLGLAMPCFFIPSSSTLASLVNEDYKEEINHARLAIKEEKYLAAVQNSQAFDSLLHFKIEYSKKTVLNKLKKYGIALATGVASLLIKSLIEKSFSK